MIFDMISCGGCRTCEMACSFKHKGEFVPSLSSIRILDKETGPGFLVFLVEENDGKGIPCDCCKGFDVPECVNYCEKAEDLKRILGEFKNKLQAKKGED